MVHHRHITATEAGGRLDQVLAGWLGLSRAQVRQLLESGQIRLNGRRVGRRAKGRLLAVDDRLEVTDFQRPADQRAVPEPEQPLAVVSAASGWIIVDKPAGVGVHPLQPDERGTLLNAVIARYPQIHGVGEGGLRSGVVHRLDVTTSGAVLFALEQGVWQWLRSAFRRHAVRKVYRAIVCGRATGEGRDVLPLVIRQHRPARVAVADSFSRPARRCALRWRVLHTFADASEVEIELETGFLHQIRVMLAHRGHPIVGDAVYARSAALSASLRPLIARPLLHAQRLQFEQVAGTCTLPGDYVAALAALRNGALVFEPAEYD